MKISLPIEKPVLWILFFAFCCVMLGVITSFTDVVWFEQVYTVEDGFIEWLTVIALLAISGLMFFRYYKLKEHKPGVFLFTLILSGILALMGAGEEVSWGQRFLNIESPDFFVKHNAQGETNVHNLLVQGKRINKIIFSQFLMGLILIYLVILPVFYHRTDVVKNFIDLKFGVAIPKLYQVFFFFFFMGVIGLSPSGKRAELMEFSSCFVFFICLLYPHNKQIYSIKKEREHVVV
jgi:hypothetical protein